MKVPLKLRETGRGDAASRRARAVGFWRGRVHRVLDALSEGGLEVHEAEHGITRHGPCPRVRMEVLDARLWQSLALRGPVAAAEAYMDGWWRSEDLPGVIAVFARNLRVLEGLDGTGWQRFTVWTRRLMRHLARNTPRGSRRNIRAHYDLGNDFFRLFLDPSMTYSSAIFETPDASLEEASEAKLDRICRKLELSPEDHVLEIGTGWGSFALHAARRYGCRVTTTTISQEQHALASRRVREAGLEGLVEVLLEDYRELRGQYDKLVSVEMIEAVGHSFLGTFLGKCADLLAPHGQMVLQAITIRDDRYERARRNPDFIQTHIFPGSFIPSVSLMMRRAAEHTDLRLLHFEDFAAHYARTLAMWRTTFLDRLAEARELGYDEPWLRMWDYYLAYCEAGFVERHTGVAQLLLAKSGCRRDAILPDREALVSRPAWI